MRYTDEMGFAGILGARKEKIGTYPYSYPLVGVDISFV
jgi:starvation-inducible outer membrane lipoprotein